MDQGVADRLGDADQQLVQDGAGDMAAAGRRQHLPGFGCRGAGQLDQGGGVFQRIGGGGQSLEIGGVLEAAAGVAGAGRRHQPRMCPLHDIEHRRRRGRRGIQAQPRHRARWPSQLKAKR
jgi:hypothetical protein